MTSPATSSEKRTRAARPLGRFLLALLLLIVLLVLLLRLPPVATSLTNRIMASIPTFQNAQIEVGRVTGGLLSGAKLSGVIIRSNSGDTLLTANTLSVRYNLRSLARRSFEISMLEIDGLVLAATQLPDSTWDFVRAFEAEATENPIVLRVGDLQIRNSVGVVQPLEKNTVTMDRLTARIFDLRVPGEITANIDSLSARVVTGDIDGELRMHAAYANSLLVLQSATFATQRSDVRAEGQARLPLPAPKRYPPDETFRFQIDASSLALSDATEFAPWLNPEGSASGSVTIAGSAASVGVEIDAVAGGGNIWTGFVLENANGIFGEATLTNVNPNLLLANETGVESITGSGRIDVRGSEIRAMGGSVNGALQNIQLADGRSGRADFELRGREGFWSGNTTLGVGAGNATLAVNADLANTNTPASAKGYFSNLDLALVSQRLASSLTGHLDINGDLTPAGGARLRSTISITPSTLGQYAIDEGIVRTSTRGGITKVNLESQVDGRPLVAAIEYQADRRRLNISTLSTDSLEVGRIWNSKIPVVVSGRSQGVVDLAKTTGALLVDLQGSSYGKYRVDSTKARVEWDAKALTADGSGFLGPGNFDYLVEFDIPSKLYTATGDFEDMNVVDILNSDIAKTEADGRYWVRSLPGKQPHLNYTVELDQSVLNDEVIETGRITGTIDGLVNTLDGRVRIGKEDQSFAAQIVVNRVESGEPVKPPTIRLTGATFSNLNVGPMIGIPTLETGLNVRSTVLEDREVLSILPSSTINGLRIDEGWIEWVPTDSMSVATWQTVSNGRSSSGTLHLDGYNRLHSLDARFDSTDVAALIGLDSVASAVTGSIDLKKVGNGWDLLATSSKGRLGDLDMQNLSVDGTLRDSLLTFRSLELISNALDVSGGGQLALASAPAATPLVLDVNAKNLHLLQPLLRSSPDLHGRGIAKITFDSDGNSNLLDVNIESETESLAYGDFVTGATSFYADVLVNKNWEIDEAEFSGNVLQFSTPSIAVRNTNILGSIADDSLKIEVIPTMDRRRRGYLFGTMNLSDSVRTFLVNNLDMQVDADTWSLLQPAEISLDDKWEIRNMLIFTDDQQIAVDGLIDLNGEQSLLLTLENIRIGGFADLMKLSGLDGTLNGYIDLTGHANAPVMIGDLGLDIQNKSRDVGHLQLDLSYEDLRLTLDGIIEHEDGSVLTAVGYLPVDLRLSSSQGQTESGVRVSARTATADSEVNFKLIADEFASDWLEPFFDPTIVNVVGGKLTADIDVTGTVDSPELAGTATVSNGRLGLPVFGRVYEPITAELTFNGDEIAIEHAEIRSGQGELLADGVVKLTQLNLGDVDISLSAENFFAVDNSLYRGRVSADLLMSGTTKSPYLSGYVQVIEGDLFLNDEIEEFEPVKLGEDDLRELERVFGKQVTASDTTTFDFYKALTLDVNVELERNTWLRSNANPKMNVQLYGDLDAQKESGGDLELYGPVDAIAGRSKVEAFGKKFVIDRGSVVYNGPVADPVLDIQASYDVKRRSDENRVVITLNASGTLDDLELTLDSDPTMDQTNILSYIAFGRPASESLQLGGGTGGTLAADLAIGRLTGFLEGLAGSELGLDVVEIEQDGLDTRLTAGKYIHPRVFLAVSQALSLRDESATSSESSPREITLELEVVKRLLLRLTQRESISVNLLWQYAY